MTDKFPMNEVRSDFAVWTDKVCTLLSEVWPKHYKLFRFIDGAEFKRCTNGENFEDLYTHGEFKEWKDKSPDEFQKFIDDNLDTFQSMMWFGDSGHAYLYIALVPQLFEEKSSLFNEGDRFFGTGEDLSKKESIHKRKKMNEYVVFLLATFFLASSDGNDWANDADYMEESLDKYIYEVDTIGSDARWRKYEIRCDMVEKMKEYIKRKREPDYMEE